MRRTRGAVALGRRAGLPVPVGTGTTTDLVTVTVAAGTVTVTYKMPPCREELALGVAVGLARLEVGRRVEKLGLGLRLGPELEVEVEPAAEVELEPGARVGLCRELELELEPEVGAGAGAGGAGWLTSGFLLPGGGKKEGARGKTGALTPMRRSIGMSFGSALAAVAPWPACGTSTRNGFTRCA